MQKNKHQILINGRTRKLLKLQLDNISLRAEGPIKYKVNNNSN